MTETATPEALAKVRKLFAMWFQDPMNYDTYIPLDAQLGLTEAFARTLTEQARAKDVEIERLRAALQFIQGNYQPACPFCVEHRDRARAAAEQMQSHPECHPAALCDGPEQAREIAQENLCWEPNHDNEDGTRAKRLYCINCVDVAMKNAKRTTWGAASPYIRHIGNCNYFNRVFGVSHECTCGLDRASTAAQGESK